MSLFRLQQCLALYLLYKRYRRRRIRQGLNSIEDDSPPNNNVPGASGSHSENSLSLNQDNSYLTAVNVKKMLQVPRCLLFLEEMCQQMDFTGFTALYTFENIIKGSLDSSNVLTKKSLVSSDEIPHLCDCFLVNENGKIGCCLYRVLIDVLGEETVYHLGFHTRSFQEILLTFLNSAGYIVTEESNMDITFLLNLFTGCLNTLSDEL